MPPPMIKVMRLSRAVSHETAFAATACANPRAGSLNAAAVTPLAIAALRLARGVRASWRMKARTLSAVLSVTLLPRRRLATRWPSLTERRPNLVGVRPVSARWASISARRARARVGMRGSLVGNSPLVNGPFVVASAGRRGRRPGAPTPGGSIAQSIPAAHGNGNSLDVQAAQARIGLGRAQLARRFVPFPGFARLRLEPHDLEARKLGWIVGGRQRQGAVRQADLGGALEELACGIDVAASQLLLALGVEAE